MFQRQLKFQLVQIFLLIFNLNCSNIHFLSIKDFQKEKLKYRFSFFIFRKAAVVKIKFKKIGNNTYMAELNGKTCGIIGLFTAFRKDKYVSFMKYDEKLKRFIPIKFIKKTQINKKTRESEYFFDFEHGWIKKVIKKFKNGKLIKRKEYVIFLNSLCDDYLTAIYNFRMGVYGFPEKNNEVMIKVFPEKRKKNRFIRIFLIKKYKDKFLLKAKIFKDIVKTKRDEIEGVIDTKMVPLEGILPGVPIFGDIKAYIMR